MVMERDDSAPKLTRVGACYQAEVPPYTPAPDNRTEPADGCRLVWQHCKRGANAAGEADAFVEKLSGLMTQPAVLDAEKALYLLMHSEYSGRSALAAVQRAANTATGASASPPPKQSRRGRRRGGPRRDRGGGGSVEHCFACKHGGTVLLCDEPQCERLFHIECAGLDDIPHGDFFCGRHSCALCAHKSAPSSQCHLCSVAYCERHRPVMSQSNGEYKCLNCCRDAPARLEFLKKVAAFHPWPSIRGIIVDPWVLYQSVQLLGDFKLFDTSCWEFVARHLGFVSPDAAVIEVLRKAHADILLAFGLSHQLKSPSKEGISPQTPLKPPPEVVASEISGQSPSRGSETALLNSGEHVLASLVPTLPSRGVVSDPQSPVTNVHSTSVAAPKEPPTISPGESEPSRAPRGPIKLIRRKRAIPATIVPGHPSPSTAAEQTVGNTAKRHHEVHAESCKEVTKAVIAQQLPDVGPQLEVASTAVTRAEVAEPAQALPHGAEG